MRLWWKTVADVIVEVDDLSTAKSNAMGRCKVSLGVATQQRQQEQQQ
jgi:hypothetical protein